MLPIGSIPYAENGRSINVDPVAFEVFGIPIRWYGLIITFGMLLGILLALREVRRQGENDEWFLDMMLIAIPVGLLCARLYYVAFNWVGYAGDLASALNFRQGGMAIHGGVLGGTAAGYLYIRYRGAKFWKWADIVAPSLILAQAIGRWGNFFNQEAYGVPTNLPWAMYIAGEYRHPTFLYESLWNLAVFGLLMWFLRNKRFHGQIAALYAVGYSLGRFWIEGLRTDSLMLGPWRIAQVVSLGLIAAGGLFYYYQSKREQH
ncbi:MAG: phosphatidylglycerol:prolipoprotein diacylglycerol transferase [Bacillota bacterium]|nr:MAG: phosphatidylglycerol:prolipoprotein diacylglycerol transferase [Bacillota bacterium]